MPETDFREAIAAMIGREARPVDKLGHQPRLYALSRRVGHGLEYDDDVVFAAAWLHDLGVFEGHRPEDPAALATWDHTAYAIRETPRILRECGFPGEKTGAVLEAIRTHQPADTPATLEGVILRDADILEQLGAIAVLRMVSKTGRDTRFPTFTTVVESLRSSLRGLPGQIRLETTRALAQPKILALEAFLEAVGQEAGPNLF